MIRRRKSKETFQSGDHIKARSDAEKLQIHLAVRLLTM